jgi:hypothetical protein
MVTDWIFEDNLRAFVLAIAQFAGYPFDEDDWLAIRSGIEGTDEEAGHRFDYEFPGRHVLRFWLARDPGTAVVHARVEAPPGVVPKVEAALQIFQFFHMKADG